MAGRQERKQRAGRKWKAEEGKMRGDKRFLSEKMWFSWGREESERPDAVRQKGYRLEQRREGETEQREKSSQFQ